MTGLTELSGRQFEGMIVVLCSDVLMKRITSLPDKLLDNFW